MSAFFEWIHGFFQNLFLKGFWARFQWPDWAWLAVLAFGLVYGIRRGFVAVFGELLLAELRAGEKDSRIELKSSGETRIDGRPAFRLHLTERTARGAQYERIVAAVRGETKIFWTSCTALARYYFERARPVCEQTIATVRLAPL